MKSVLKMKSVLIFALIVTAPSVADNTQLIDSRNRHNG
jgi:hypothetical protein